jgi:hypothetical protein
MIIVGPNLRPILNLDLVILLHALDYWTIGWDTNLFKIPVEERIQLLSRVTSIEKFRIGFVNKEALAFFERKNSPKENNF